MDSNSFYNQLKQAEKKKKEANQKEMDEKLARSESYMKQDLEKGKQFASDLLGTEGLGRIKDTSEYQESLSLLRSTMPSSQESLARREQATRGLQGAEATSNRQLLASLSAAGVRGGAAAGALGSLASGNVERRRAMEQDLYLTDTNLRNQAIQNITGYQTSAAQFDISQAAAEKNLFLQTQLGFAQMGQNERSAIEQSQTALEAARIKAGASGGK